MVLTSTSIFTGIARRQENRPPRFSRDIFNLSLAPPLSPFSLSPLSLTCLHPGYSRSLQQPVDHGARWLRYLSLFCVRVCTRCALYTHAQHLRRGYGFDTGSAAVWEMLGDACQVILNVREPPLLLHSLPPSSPLLIPLLWTVSAAVSVSYDTFHCDFFRGEGAMSDVWGLTSQRVEWTLWPT